MTATTEIKPGAARVSHIEGHLLADPVLKAHMGPKDADVPRRDGITVIKCHRLSVEVTLRMLKDGVEPMQAHKSVVGDYARIILDEQAENALSGQPEPAESAEPVAPAEVAPPVTAPKAVTPAAPKAAAPKAAPSAPSAPSAPAAPAAPAPAPAETAISPGDAPPVVAPAAPAAPVPKAVAAKKAVAKKPVVAAAVAEPAPAVEPPSQEKSATQEKEPEVNILIVAYSLLMSAQEVAERDQQPGADDRRVALSKVLKSYRDALVL